jgi:hypothetical protein
MPHVKKIVIFLSIISSAILGALICFFSLSAFNKINLNIDLIISIDDKVETYTGNPVYASNYKIESGKLSKGDYIDITYTGSQTNVGEAKSSAIVKVFNSSNYDVTNNYSITVKSGNIKVNKRNLTLVPSESIVYSKNFIDETSFKIIDGEINKSEHIVPTLLDDYKRGDSFANVGAYVYDYYGNNVTSNYNLVISESLKIEKIPLTIISQDASKIYDGKSLFNKSYLTEGLLSGDYLDYNSIQSYTEITNVSESGTLNEIPESEIVIKDSFGAKVTNSYQLICQEIGRLYIEPKDITVTTNSYTATYLDELEQNSWHSNDETFDIKFANLGQMDEFESAGTYINKVTFESQDELKNYRITYNFGIVNINRLVVNVYLPTLVASSCDDKNTILSSISRQDIKISNLEAQEIPLLLSFDCPDYDFSIQGTYYYSAHLLEDNPNYLLIIHAGNIIIN